MTTKTQMQIISDLRSALAEQLGLPKADVSASDEHGKSLTPPTVPGGRGSLRIDITRGNAGYGIKGETYLVVEDGAGAPLHTFVASTWDGDLPAAVSLVRGML